MVWSKAHKTNVCSSQKYVAQNIVYRVLTSQYMV